MAQTYRLQATGANVWIQEHVGSQDIEMNKAEFVCVCVRKDFDFQTVFLSVQEVEGMEQRYKKKLRANQYFPVWFSSVPPLIDSVHTISFTFII